MSRASSMVGSFSLLFVGCNDAPLRPSSDAGTAPNVVGIDASRDKVDAGPFVDASPPMSEAWHVVFDAWESPLLSVWALDDSAFFVGEGGSILVRDADEWWQHEDVTSQTLWWVWGRSTEDVFAGGEGGTLLHFDGEEWTSIDAGLEEEETVWGIWGSEGEVWLVGGRARTNGPGFAVVFDGTTWSRVEITEDTPNLYKVWGSGEDEVLIVGDDTSLFRYNGQRATEVELGAAGVNPEPLFTVSGNEDGIVFAVGGINQGLAFERATAGFAEVPFTTLGLNGVFVSDDADVYVVGLFGVIRRRHGGAWQVEDTMSNRHYHAVVALPSGGAYAVGGDLLAEGDGRKGLIVARGRAFSQSFPVVNTVRHVTVAPDDAGLGDGGAKGVADAGARELAPDASKREHDASVVMPEPASDAGRELAEAGAGRDAASPERLDAEAPALPGPSELCTEDLACAPNLECWYVQGESELRCLLPCEDATECPPEFGEGARCAPAGCQTSAAVCLRAEWQACL